MSRLSRSSSMIFTFLSILLLSIQSCLCDDIIIQGIYYDPDIYSMIPLNGNEATCDVSILQSDIISSYYNTSLTYEVNLDDIYQLNSIKNAVNVFYGKIFKSKNYSTMVEPSVNASTTFSEVIHSLSPLLREPIEIYAGYTDDDDDEYPGITQLGDLYCGGISSVIHIIPSTTGLSEVGALRDAINSVLPPLIPSTEPSVLSLVNNSMKLMNVLPLNENGNNWLLNDLSSIELEYTVIQTSSTSTLSSIPEVGFFTEGDVTRDGSYNLQDIKGVKFVMNINVEGGLMEGDVISFSINNDSFEASIQQPFTSHNNTVTPSISLLYINQNGTQTHQTEGLTSLSDLKALTNLPVTFGNSLGESQLSVFLEVDGSDNQNIVMSKFSMTTGNIQYLFPSLQ